MTLWLRPAVDNRLSWWLRDFSGKEVGYVSLLFGSWASVWGMVESGAGSAWLGMAGRGTPESVDPDDPKPTLVSNKLVRARASELSMGSVLSRGLGSGIWLVSSSSHNL